MPARASYPQKTVDKAVRLATTMTAMAVSRKLAVPYETVRNWIDSAKSGRVLRRSPSADDVLAEAVKIFTKHGPSLTWARYCALSAWPGMCMKHFGSYQRMRDLACSKAGLGGAAIDHRERRRYDDRIAALQKNLRDAQREANANEDVRRAIFRLADQPVGQPEWTVPVKPPKSKPGIPMLFASDFQWGEVIKANELDGINAFNRDIASTRYKRLIERAVDLCTQHMVNPDYPGIIYLRGGDMISGDIHQELRETNDLQSIPAVLDLVEHEKAGILTLAEKFGKVWVISVPGNHGRTTIKPHAKAFVETNYDYLSAMMLERELAGDKRIQWRTPMSGDARFAVYGWQFLLTHGDRIGSSGGQGFIGPAATITRGMKKLTDYYATLGQHIDWTLVGHFHTPLELEYGWSNGSLPGYSEYAKTFRMRPAPPQQWLLFVHPSNGVTCRWPIQLAPRPKLIAGGAAVEF